jgi:hypothetical protein
MQQTPDPGDASGDITWMSYAELGQLRGISTASAKRLSNRRRWRKQAGNDGTTRVAVPVAEAASRETVSGDDPRDDPGDVPLHAKALAALEDALTAANTRAEAAVALADRTLAQLADAHARAERAEAAITGERQHADALRDRLEAMQHDLDATNADLAGARTLSDEIEAAMQARIAAAQDALTALRKAETDRKARGLVARLRAAWRGE